MTRFRILMTISSPDSETDEEKGAQGKDPRSTTLFSPQWQTELYNHLIHCFVLALPWTQQLPTGYSIACTRRNLNHNVLNALPCCEL